MKKLSTNLVKKYFIWVADKPFKSAALIVLIPAGLILLVIGVFLEDSTTNTNLADQVAKITALVFVGISAINLIVPFFFMTYFYKNKRQIVLIKDRDGEEDYVVYRRPFWGKAPVIEIVFPEGWDLRRDDDSRQLELGIIFRISSKILAFLKIKVHFQFNGDFQAVDLEEMIRQQGNIARGQTSFHFRECLQKIVSRFLSDRRELIKDDLIGWQQGTVTTKELETRWFKPEIIFQNLFCNVNSMEMKLWTPEIAVTRENKK